MVGPWSRNVARSLIKEPGIYLYVWSAMEDEGFRCGNLAAVHLLKAVRLWTVPGFGEFGLHYLRDKPGREADRSRIKAPGSPGCEVLPGFLRMAGYDCRVFRGG